LFIENNKLLRQRKQRDIVDSR